ncbi:MAG TPA: hypothetical protein VF660_07900 [Actinomycetota bacterium]
MESWWIRGITIAWKPEVVTATFTVVYAAAAVATFFVIFVATTTATKQLSETRATRLTELMTDLSRRWDEPSMLHARQVEGSFRTADRLRAKFPRLYEKNHSKAYEALRIPDFFEDVAIFVKEGHLPPETVRLSLGTPMVRHWDYWKKTVDYFRSSQPTAYANWEEVATELR